MGIEQSIRWPALPLAVIAEDSKDEFYEKAVTVKEDAADLVLDLSLVATVRLPLALSSDMSAEEVTVLVIERMLVDINVDLLPAIIRKLKKAGM